MMSGWTPDGCSTGWANPAEWIIEVASTQFSVSLDFSCWSVIALMHSSMSSSGFSSSLFALSILSLSFIARWYSSWNASLCCFALSSNTNFCWFSTSNLFWTKASCSSYVCPGDRGNSTILSIRTEVSVWGVRGDFWRGVFGSRGSTGSCVDLRSACETDESIDCVPAIEGAATGGALAIIASMGLATTGVEVEGTFLTLPGTFVMEWARTLDCLRALASEGGGALMARGDPRWTGALTSDVVPRVWSLWTKLGIASSFKNRLNGSGKGGFCSNETWTRPRAFSIWSCIAGWKSLICSMTAMRASSTWDLASFAATK